MRIQTFIDYRKKFGPLSGEIEKKRKAVVRDWFRLILWYVRLRKASKAFNSHYQGIKNFNFMDVSDQWIYKSFPGIPHSLLEVELRIQ